MQEAAELIIPMLAIILSFSIPILYIVFRHAERYELINRGVDIIEYTRALREGTDPRRGLFNTLRIGLLAIFLGIGIAIGSTIASQVPDPRAEDSIMFSSILICGGLGLIIYYVIVAKLTKK
jgi:hypothetical protein